VQLVLISLIVFKGGGKALIVHFSGTPPTGGDFKSQFPNGIKNVRDLGAMTSRSSRSWFAVVWSSVDTRR
jgi:hypothetical protein